MKKILEDSLKVIFNIEKVNKLIIGDALIRRMVRIGLLKENERKLDYVLGLTLS
jgi:hypothetical protein